jgi:hypothetical protein
MSGGADYFAHCDPRGRPDFWVNEEPHQEDGYLTDLLSRRAVDFVKRQSGRPAFFLSCTTRRRTGPGKPVMTAPTAERLQAWASRI